MKVFLIRILWLIPFFSVIGIVNYNKDVGGKFNKETIDQAVLWSIKGDNVSKVPRYHRRYFNKKYIALLEKKLDVVVFGSSKSDKITHGLFPDKSFHNFWIENGTIYETISFFKSFEKKENLPDHIILELNPFSLSINPDFTDFDVANDYNEMVDKLDEENQRIRFLRLKDYVQDLKRLFSVNYFLSNLKMDKNESIITNDSVGNRIVLRDGSSSHPFYNDTNVTDIIVRKEVRNLATEIAKPYKEEKIILQNFLKYLTEEKKIQVSLFVLPFHPDVYKHPEMQQTILKWNDYLSFLTKNNEVEIIGGLNPMDFDLKKTSYVDAVHINKASFAQIFKLYRKNKEIQGIN